MTKIKKVLSVALVLLFSCSAFSFAMEKDDPIMLRGIRPMGMGGAFTAVADDENAVFYNPAGIAQRSGQLIQIFNINTAISGDTIKAASDAMNTFGNLSDGSDGSTIADDFIKVKDTIADRDLSFMLSLVNPAYISAPISVGKSSNTVSFGIGIFNSVNIGVRAGMQIPRFMLDFIQLAAAGDFNDDSSFLNAIGDSMLGGVLNPGVSVSDVRAAVAAGEDWSSISHYFSGDFITLVNDIQTIIDNSALSDGEKYSQITDALNTFATAPNRGAWSMEGTYAKATVNSYATATLDVPFSYKFDFLEALHIPGKLSLGANLKYIQRAKFSETVRIERDQIKQLLDGDDIETVIDTKVGASYGQGFGLDFGALYSLNQRLHFGLQVSDVLTNINYSRGYSFNDTYPDSDFTHTAYIAPQVNIGVSYIPENILGWNPQNRLMVAADIRDIFGAYTDSFQNHIHIGAEYRYGCLALRAGLNQLRPAFGLGLEFNVFQLSYAYYGEESTLARMIGDTATVYYHQFLLSFKIGHNQGRKIASVPAKEEAKQEAPAPAKSK